MGVWAVVPVKELDRAKERLAPDRLDDILLALNSKDPAALKSAGAAV